MDVWWLLRKLLFGVPVLDYAMPGRWIGHLARGRLRHAAIKTAAPVAGERALGWTAHYAIGVAIAGLLLAIAGTDWAHAPSLTPARQVTHRPYGVGSSATRPRLSPE
jgi:hypothetical protein